MASFLTLPEMLLQMLYRYWWGVHMMMQSASATTCHVSCVRYVYNNREFKCGLMCEGSATV